MKTRVLALVLASTAAMALAAQAAPAAAPADPAKPSPAPAVTPTLPTAPEEATPATPAMPAPPAAAKVTPPAPTDTPPATSSEPAPAFRAGAKVSDSSGADIGVIQSIAEASTGAMVVLKVDGKLVSVPQGTLSPFGENVKSSQTKAQILAAAPKS
jgi:hypothetical protein